MKYVAFLDILGFKDTLKSKTQSEAEKFISSFSSTAYNEWKKADVGLLQGFIVSDSFIIYSKDTSCEALKNMISIVDAICKAEFVENGVLIRGAIAKGEFERLETTELSSLKNGLIVGKAYIDAYLLESSVKMIGIILSEEVYEDTQELLDNNRNIVREKGEEKDTHIMILRYLTLNYLQTKTNLEKFVRLAQKGNWRPHYYNALNFALINENKHKMVYQLFDNLFSLIADNNPGNNYRHIDLFINNAFNNSVLLTFQKRFLKYLRNRIYIMGD